MAKLSGKHRATRDLIFQEPTSSTVKYSELISLLKALGYEVKSGRGSTRKACFPELDNRIVIFHEPHGKGKEICKEAVEDFREIFKSLQDIEE